MNSDTITINTRDLGTLTLVEHPQSSLHLYWQTAEGKRASRFFTTEAEAREGIAYRV